jgi:hypothetical protein
MVRELWGWLQDRLLWHDSHLVLLGLSLGDTATASDDLKKLVIAWAIRTVHHCTLQSDLVAKAAQLSIIVTASIAFPKVDASVSLTAILINNHIIFTYKSTVDWLVFTGPGLQLLKVRLETLTRCPVELTLIGVGLDNQAQSTADKIPWDASTIWTHTWWDIVAVCHAHLTCSCTRILAAWTLVTSTVAWDGL